MIGGGTSTARIELFGREVPSRRADVTGEIVVPQKSRDLDLRPSLRIQPAEGSALRYGDVLRIVAPHGPDLRYRDVFDVELAAMEGRGEGGEGDGDGTEVFRWSAELSAGRYLFVVEPVQHGVFLDVPETPNGGIRIVLPDLFPVTLRVIDAGTREPIEDATVRWSRRFREGDADGWIEMDLESGAESATAHLTGGPFFFAASAPSYGERSMEAYAGPGENLFTLELSPCILREIILVHGDTVVPWGPGMTCRFRTLGSDESHPCQSPGDGRRRACFEQPGLYEILVGELEGFRDLEPVVLDVREGDLTPVRLQLER